MQGLLDDIQRASYNAAIRGVFETFMLPFQIYLDAQIAVVNTSPSFGGMFGDQSQDAVGPTSTPLTPQVFTVSGCIRYGNGQPWQFIEGGSRSDYQQNKVRESEGVVRIKVDQSGYAFLKQANQVVLDGITFDLNSTARPHGIVGAPDRYTFTLQRVDPS